MLPAAPRVPVDGENSLVTKPSPRRGRSRRDTGGHQPGAFRVCKRETRVQLGLSRRPASGWQTPPSSCVCVAHESWGMTF